MGSVFFYAKIKKEWRIDNYKLQRRRQSYAYDRFQFDKNSTLFV